jgi:hypothetical protein
MDFSQEQDFPGSDVVLELWRNSSPNHHFCGGKVMLLRLSSRTTLEQFAPRKTVLYVVSCEEIALRKILLPREIQATRTDAIFNKIYMKTIVKS